MNVHTHGWMAGTRARLAVAALLLSTLPLIPATGRAMELIPSIGMTKSTDTSGGDSKFSGGLALRWPVLPFLKLEGGITYREDSFDDDALKLRQWPVTVSAWVFPFPMLYAGGGLGWYRSTYDYKDPLLNDTTTDDIGIHLGGGVIVPLGPKLGLDLNGRYIFMQKNNDIQLPTTFDPDFWNASLGLAIRF
jgi:hypothetical protein